MELVADTLSNNHTSVYTSTYPISTSIYHDVVVRAVVRAHDTVDNRNWHKLCDLDSDCLTFLCQRAVLWCGLVVLLLLLTLAQPQIAHAAPLTQSNPGTSPQLYLLPRDAANNNVVVDSHIAKLRVVDDAAGPFLNVNASYHLRNPADSEVILPLMLFPGGDQSLSGYQNLTLTQNFQTLLLQPGDGGGFFSQIALGAGQRATLTLQYQVSLGNDSLATVRYAPSILNGWSGNISLRVEIELPSTIPAESWIEIMPADWRYSVNADDASILGLRWLYDFNVPEDAIRIRFIEPRVWADLRAAEGAVTQNAAVSAFVRLGDLYRDLARIAPSDSARQRFYAQAIAAYGGGVTSAGFALATPSERASLHIGLADLYRRRLVEMGASQQSGYTDLMVAEITQALAILPFDDARAAELRQWQVDGMQLQLNEARDRRDWPTSLAIVEELALLPADVVDPAVVAEDRRFILIQQALDLMEQGNRVAALAIAGDQIAADTLLPPPQAASLFNGWQLTLTVSPEAMQLVALGLTHPDRHAEALGALESLVDIWENGTAGEAYELRLDDIPAEVSLQSGVRLQIDFPAAGNGARLARLLPPRTDYALLRGVLTQLAPTTERNNGVIWQRIEMRQPLNLTTVIKEWNTIAAGLDEQAAAFEAQSNTLDAGETSSAEAALTARLQAVNYRTTATEWRRLARQSSLLFSFQINDPVFTRFKGEPPSRAWTITASAPSQTFVFQTQVLSLSRVLVGLVLTFIVLISVAGALWGLL